MKRIITSFILLFILLGNINAQNLTLSNTKLDELKLLAPLDSIKYIP